MKYYICILFALFATIQVKLFTGVNSFHTLSGLEKEVAQLNGVIKSHKARNTALAAEVHDLRFGTDAIEERARQQLGYIAPGESFYRVIDD